MRWIVGFGILLGYVFGGFPRRAANWLQRRGNGEHKAERRPLPTSAEYEGTRLETPEQLEAYAQKHFKYRRDSGRLGGFVYPLDYVTEPEVFQARLESGAVRDGDCDDYHHWFARCLEQLENPPTEVLALSSGFRRAKGATDADGNKLPRQGGHTTCVYLQGGNWYHVNYRIRLVENPNDAPRLVAEKHGDPSDPRVPWYVFETTSFRRVRSSPKGRLEVG